MLTQLGAFYTKKGWSSYAKLGMELADFVKSRNPRTPEQQVDTYIKLLNRLLGDTAQFKVLNWEGTAPRRAAIIGILPPSSSQ